MGHYIEQPNSPIDGIELCRKKINDKECTFVLVTFVEFTANQHIMISVKSFVFGKLLVLMMMSPDLLCFNLGTL